MSGLFDKMGESIRGVTEGLSKGREAYVIGAEKRLRVERIKININNLRKEKDDQINRWRTSCMRNTLKERCQIPICWRPAKKLKCCNGR